MKKEYIKPIVNETIALGDDVMLVYQSYDHADSKGNRLDFEEDYADEEGNEGWGQGW